MKLTQIERILSKAKSKPKVRAIHSQGTSENCYDEWLIEGLSTDGQIEVYVGDANPENRLLLAENEALFSKYSKEERKGYREYAGQWEVRWNGENTWNRKSYKGWCFYSLVLTAYVNGIQVGEQCLIDNAYEVGYAPSANVIDNDVLVWVSVSKGIEQWIETNPHIVESFAEVKVKEAKLLLKESLEKLTKRT